ncbi:unnamed protein product [Zymoseptoria tritici ST99CH_3D1]|uniref:Invertebrate defensins family profile domain-containing protein n=2 Tax=Zymoseptoria tritici TaxID=1047171 RepID=A0A1X7S4I4_ZYMT9|nr:unnamed protein product [Zymoseptoria tritici ST99CH_3D7]SMR59034.1 unnamed protein product [Zymoseptoria tritici ST99CH_1E4]SMR62874.1 unnamed protein product [Zymoseptoria tritici ST99CH_3D1]
MRSILQGLLACAFAVAVQAKCVSNGNVNDICASADNCCGSPGLDCFQDGPHKRCHTACAEGYDDGGTYGWCHHGQRCDCSKGCHCVKK